MTDDSLSFGEDKRFSEFPRVGDVRASRQEPKRDGLTEAGTSRRSVLSS
ncbi:hypothetical protein NKJ46_02115 [Mesorhizobium sp. M0166]